MVLSARDLCKSYGEGEATVTALDGVSLAVAGGEFLAITGPSGSGKSTLLALLAGLERPTSGEVWLAGRRLSEAKDADLAKLRRREIGFVFQTFNLLSVLTVEENVALPFLLDRKPPREWERPVAEALELVGLSHRRDHSPERISVGERQRVAIARALAVRPRILFTDEPTGSLDSERGREVIALLRSAAEQGCAVVMVTHDGAAAARADRTLRLRDGRLQLPTSQVKAC
jgi:putative ABC transport system ATP-binding protein